jgi:hypothetical protein
MDQYFAQMDKIIKEKKTSSRIRFMLQDVIDLRRVQLHHPPHPSLYNVLFSFLLLLVSTHFLAVSLPLSFCIFLALYLSHNSFQRALLTWETFKLPKKEKWTINKIEINKKKQ